MLRNRAPERFADGKRANGLGGLNAVGKMELARLEKEWRAQYERERAQGGEARVFEAIEAKLADLRERHQNALSPRARAAWDAYQAVLAEDEAAGYRWWDDPEHPANEEGGG